MANIPPPPDGFTLDAAPSPAASGSAPPPPDGFTMDAPVISPPTAQAPAEKSSAIGDILKSAGSGVVQGAADLIGLPGTIQDAFDNSMSAVTGMKPLPSSQLSGQSLRQGAASLTGGATEYKPQTTEGKYAQTAGSFVPGAMALGSGGLFTNALRYGVVPGLTSEAAGEAAHDYAPAMEPYARLAGALLGPAAAEAGISAVNSGANAVSSLAPSVAAAQNLRKALEEAGTTQASISSDLARNPRLSPMDVDPTMQQMAMNLATQPGAARAKLSDVVANRMSTAKGAVDNALDSAMGQTPDVKAYLDNLKATTQANGKKNFTAALSGAGPVDISPVLAHIDQTVNPGVQAVVSQGSNIPQGPVEQALMRVRGMLANGNEQLTDANRLHQIQSNLRTTADTLSSSASGQDRLVGSALRNVRQKLIGQIDNSAGGKYRPAQQQYADDNAIQDAFDKGRTILSNGGPASDAALENRPEYWRDWVTNASQPEIDAAKVGARVAADNMINSVRAAAAKGIAIPEVGFNRGRFEALLGKPETDVLAQALQDEGAMAKTNANLFAGSQTAPRQAVNMLTKVANSTGEAAGWTVPAIIGHDVAGLPGMLAGAAASGVGKLATTALSKRDQLRNALMAKAVSGNQATFQNALSPRLAGPLIAPNRLADPRAAALAAALAETGQMPRRSGQ